MKVNLTCIHGAGEITGSNFLLEIAETKLLVDCGLIQGERFAEEENREPFPFDPKQIKYLFITHAHIDHIGRIPKLVRDGFEGTIFSTPETLSLARVMLADSYRVLLDEAKVEGREELFSLADLDHALGFWSTIPYHERRKFDEGFKVYFKDAGHVLGSAIIEIEINGKKIVFCGDLGNTPTPLLKDTEEVTDATYMLMDSVYGDRDHESLIIRRRKFEEVVKSSIKRGGVLVIPAFSMERTQVLIYELNNMVEGKRIPLIPVFIDSPLAIAVTAIYKAKMGDFNPEIQNQIKGGDNIFQFPKLKMCHTAEDSKAIAHVPGPKIIIAGSGMSNGGRVVHHERNYLPDPKSTILLVGYQAVGTLGRRLQDGTKEVVLYKETIPVRARIEKIDGFSAHKDSTRLLEFAEKSADSLKILFIVLGEPRSSLFLVQKLREYLGINAICPERNKKYELEF